MWEDQEVLFDPFLDSKQTLGEEATSEGYVVKGDVRKRRR
jgi:hypothetical protein